MTDHKILHNFADKHSPDELNLRKLLYCTGSVMKTSSLSYDKSLHLVFYNRKRSCSTAVFSKIEASRGCLCSIPEVIRSRHCVLQRMNVLFF